jgi:hypothetical protein
VQDFYDCGTGDFVWDFFQLGIGGDLLDIEMDGSMLDHLLRTLAK